MAKILISSLGTGSLDERNISSRDYKKAVYRFEKTGEEHETSFVAAALSKHLEVDKIYLVGTSKSMWEEVYNYFSNVCGQPFDETYWGELADEVEAFKYGCPPINEKKLENVSKAMDGYLKHLKASATGGSRCYVIDYGLNETELWHNLDVFMQIGEQLNEDDEVFLDITHSFRSVSLFNYLLLDLIGILKFKSKFKLGGLFYGMLDVVREIGFAPIVDLSPMYNVTLWSRGAYNFTNFGNGYLLADLIGEEDISKSINNVSDIVNINHIDEFKREIDSLAGLLDGAVPSDPIIKHMLPFLNSFTDRFKGISSTSELQFALAEWYFENKRFAQGYICLTECIITRTLEIYRRNNSKISFSIYNRDKVKKLIAITSEQSSKDKSRYNDLRKEFEVLRDIRNAIAHAGYAENSSYSEAIKDTDHHLNKVRKIIFNDSVLKDLAKEFPFRNL